MLLRGSLQNVEFPDVEEFCRTWAEGVRVEYKRELVSGHIPKVVSSLANTMGGIWLIGVATDESNRPVFPLSGVPRESGLEERITQSCYQGLYPSLVPDIKVVDMSAGSARVIILVRVPESIEAPHAIENSTKIYIRTNSTSEIIQLADIDRIEYLLKRRQQPEQKREQMIEDMASRVRVARPRIRVVVSPRYPSRPIFGEDELKARFQAFSPPGTYSTLLVSLRLVRQGLMSITPSPVRYHFEVNIYGVISLYVPLEIEETNIFLDQIVREIGRAFDVARHVLKWKAGNFQVRVNLDGVQERFLVVSPPQGRLQSIEELVFAENTFAPEQISDVLQFQDSVAELVRQLVWSFNWADKPRIFAITRDLLHRNGLPLQTI